MSKKKTSPRPVVIKPVEKKQVWVACRATPGCEGKTAVVTMKGSNDSGRFVRYKCLSCNRPFAVVY